jgi:hypothetical protein
MPLVQSMWAASVSFSFTAYSILLQLLAAMPSPDPASLPGHCGHICAPRLAQQHGRMCRASVVSHGIWGDRPQSHTLLSLTTVIPCPAALPSL